MSKNKKNKNEVKMAKDSMRSDKKWKKSKAVWMRRKRKKCFTCEKYSWLEKRKKETYTRKN